MLVKIYKKIKRFSDIILSTILLITMFPVLLLIYSAIIKIDGKPAIFKQKRIGINGKTFILYKFRTMSTKITSGIKNPYINTKQDPRVTRLGNVLRTLSFDELPQLICILIGEMSFVGPRPAVTDEFEHEILNQNEQKLIKFRATKPPGLTGLSQIMGRNNLTWSEKLEYDEIYIQNANSSFINAFMQDFMILIKTPTTMYKSEGFYDEKY